MLLPIIAKVMGMLNIKEQKNSSKAFKEKP